LGPKEMNRKGNLITCYLIVVSINLTACGGGGGSSAEPTTTTPPPPSNVSPTASISAPQTVDERTTTSLDGSGSSDSDGSISTYEWTISETDEAFVQIDDHTSSTATLNVGEVMETTNVTIELTVADDDGATNTNSIEIQLSEIDFDRLPPHPGQRGKEGIAGIDTNDNGVRDDVEHGIYEFHIDSKPHRDYQLLAAKGLQQSVVASLTGDINDSNVASELIYNSLHCRAAGLGLELAEAGTLLENYRKARILNAEIEILTLNTSEREDAYASYAERREGTLSIEQKPTDEECQELLMEIGITD